MAKGNLLLGTAANSVGDVTMYRREGAQVSRVRVRKVANPKTSAQCLQRSAFAPAAKFYSPLSIVLERSFEGLSKSKSYSKFLKNAVDDARANDWLLPKGTGFFPLPYKLSQGSLPQIAYSMNTAGDALNLDGLTAAAAPTTIGDFSALFIAAGYQNGDVVTIILIKGASANVDDNFVPIAAQFVINSESTDTLATALKGITFTYATSTLSIGASIGAVCAGAVIVARYENEKWRRSTQILSVAAAIMTAIADTEYKADAIASYGATDANGNPLVYLDGNTVNPQ